MTLKRREGTTAAPSGGLPSLALLAILLAAALIRFGFFTWEPPGRDQGLFATLADGVLRGKLLYRDLWEHKPPGVVWLYSAALALFGRNYLAVQALQACFAVATAWLIAWNLRRTTGSSTAAVAAALLYLLHCGGVAFGGFWATAQAEVFMDLTLCLALVLLLQARHMTGRRALLAAGAAGLMIGWTLLLKYSAAPLIGLGVLLWRPDGAARGRASMLGAFVLGCAVPVLALAAGMAVAGAWGDFVRATFEFNLAHRAASAPPDRPFLSRIFYAPGLLLALYVPALVAVGARAFQSRRRSDDPDRRLTEAAVWLWLLSLVEVAWQGRFWVYHYHVVLLPLSLLAGLGLSRILAFARHKSVRGAAAWTVTGVLLLSVPCGAALISYDAAHRVSDRWRGHATQEEMEATYVWGLPDYEFAQTRAAAEAIRKETKAGDRIFVWGFEPYVYFLSGREPASRFLYDYPLMPEFVSVHAAFGSQLMSDLARHPPVRLLVVANDANDIEPLDSVTQLRQWDALRLFVEAHYVPEWRLGDFVCFARRSE